MANGPLSPVMLIASDGLIANPSTALAANTSAFTTYQSVIQVGPVLTKALALGNIVAPGTISDLTTMGNTTVPALGDAIVANVATLANAISNTSSFTQVITARGNQILGSGDASIFAQVYGMANGYVKQANQYINSANNTAAVSSTFTSMDNLTTGSLSVVSSSISQFGRDLDAVGTTIDLSRLASLGHPWVLLRQILKAGGLLPDLYAALNLAGVTDQDILFVQGNQPNIDGALDLRIYRALQSITGNGLQEICTLLDVTLSVTTAAVNGVLTTAADLLNPKKLLPNAWPSLLVQLPSGTGSQPVTTVVFNIYLSSGEVSPQVQAYYQLDPEFIQLSRIIPADQAMANLAWSMSLQQIKNISNLPLPNLAVAASVVETNSGLDFIESLDGNTGPVPTSVKNQIYADLGTGSGPNGLLDLNDLLGTASGVPWDELIGALDDELANVSGLSAYTDVTINYTKMINMLDGDYGNVEVGPILLPGDVTVYNNANDALQPLIANVVANIATFQSSYPSQSTTLNNLWTDLTDRLIMENDNLQQASIDFGQLSTNRSAVLSLGTTLHAIGSDPDASEFFTRIANASSSSGQAIIASLREARNRDAMLAAGLGIDTQLSAD